MMTVSQGHSSFLSEEWLYDGYDSMEGAEVKGRRGKSGGRVADRNV